MLCLSPCNAWVNVDVDLNVREFLFLETTVHELTLFSFKNGFHDLYVVMFLNSLYGGYWMSKLSLKFSRLIKVS